MQLMKMVKCQIIFNILNQNKKYTTDLTILKGWYSITKYQPLFYRRPTFILSLTNFNFIVDQPLTNFYFKQPEFKNLSYGKGKYACLLLNYQTGEIVDVLPSRRLDYLQSYFNKIPNEEKENVKFLISDMYDGYKHLHDYVFHQSK